MSRRAGRKQIAPRVKPKQLMTVEAAWRVTVTRRDGSVHRYTERRGRHPEIGEAIEIRCDRTTFRRSY
jgi:hypothetical protein